jgi:LPS-assembly protein
MTRLVIFVSFLLASASVALAQDQDDPVRMIADRIEIAPDGDLIASGDIEIFYGAENLIAEEIRYDTETETLNVTGPILYTDENGDTIEAEFAQLSSDLQNGLLKSARIMLENQLELQAAEMERIDGITAELRGVVATSCISCDTRPPLWQIRASAVRHDKLKRTVHFKNAQVRVADIPILYLPRLRIPDPNQKRAAGFLVPSIRSTSRLGTGVVVPYFIPIGTDKDITLTPYISAKTRTLEVRYRQVVKNGSFTFDGAISYDDIESTSLRAYGRIVGKFNVLDGYKLGFTLQSVSDDAYIGDYQLDTSETMESNVTLERTKEDQHQEISLSNYQSLYDNEGNRPFLTSFGQIEQRVAVARIGGMLSVRGEFGGAARSSDLNATGRDIMRANTGVRYQRVWDLAAGTQVSAEHESRLDHFVIHQDDAYNRQNTTSTHSSALTLRWPLIGRSKTGAHFVEPIYQIARVRMSKDIVVPAEESTHAEFDQGNLLALSRFPAPDRVETGQRRAVGVNYNYRAMTGYELGLSLGQIEWETQPSDFSQTSGLAGFKSDLLLAAQVETPIGLNFYARTLLDDQGKAGKSEVISKFKFKKYSVDGRYSFLPADSDEQRNDDIAEWTLNQSYKMGENWQLSNSLRYDLQADSMATAGIGVKWDGQCSSIVFSADRRFTDLGTSPPQTTYGFSIALKGFSTGGASRAIKTSCGTGR